jgi:membrane protein DedA with SNARE-associated domain
MSSGTEGATKNRRRKILRIVALLVAFGISVAVFLLRSEIDIEKLKPYRYIGIFVISFLAYATVLLPAPGAAFVFTIGAAFKEVPFNTIRLALAAGSGAALGELSGYLAGMGGQAVLENRKIYQKFSGWMEKHGSVTVFALSALPNPLFDLVGLVAGALRMSPWKFLFWCWAGETLKMLVFAASGAAGLDLFQWLVGH